MPTPAPTPFTGYRPGLAMPVIAPPPDSFTGTDEQYYQQLQVDLTVTPSGTDDIYLEVAMTSAPAATVPVDSTLFAMTGGFVRCFPPGTVIPSPDGFSDPARSTLVLTVWAADVEAQARAFTASAVPVSRIYYIGVDPVATEPILRAETERMSEAALRASWKAETLASPPSGTTTAQLVDAHTARVMSGTGSLFVEWGRAIGKAAKDASAADDTYVFDLRMTDTSPPPVYVSPYPLITGLPYYEL